MSMIDLTKKAKISLEKKGLATEKAEIAFVLDISGSMSSMFNRGTIQAVTERLLAIGIHLDDNKQIQVFLFGENAHEVKIPAREGNISGYVKREVTSKYSFEGTTKYTPVMKLVAKQMTNVKQHKKEVQPTGLFGKLFGKKEVVTPIENNVSPENSQKPVFVFFVTDGDNFDQKQTEEIIKEYAHLPIFWQFIGVGRSSFTFLEKLDEMQGRFIDNANFFHVNDIDKITDEELYNRLLNEYPMWLKEARSKGVLK